MTYTIQSDDFDCYDEGGSAEFYGIKENKNLGFKQFRNKRSATIAYEHQSLLSKFYLAPIVIGAVTKLYFEWGEKTNWGYLTEKAKVLDEKIMKKRLKEIQFLVETIEQKTKLKFWDCHYYNMGYIKRNAKTKLVCIDTGAESFMSLANAWGFAKPGPKCCYCKKSQCKCSEY